MDVGSVANSETFKVTTPSDREIRMTRVFDAPRHLVFEAMVKPEHIRRWWGCLGEGYSVPVCEVDLRPGGGHARRDGAGTRGTGRQGPCCDLRPRRRQGGHRLCRGGGGCAGRDRRLRQQCIGHRCHRRFLGRLFQCGRHVGGAGHRRGGAASREIGCWRRGQHLLRRWPCR